MQNKMSHKRNASMGSPSRAGSISHTMGKTNSRRTTCDICRERKVRCNKEHPACERCKRLKLKCTYTPPADAIDVSQVLSQLQERLEQAEAALAARSVSTAPTAQPMAEFHDPTMPAWSNDILLDLNDPNLFFPSPEETFPTENFSGSWSVPTELPGPSPTIRNATQSLPPFSHPGTESMEGIHQQAAFQPTFQPGISSKASQPPSIARSRSPSSLTASPTSSLDVSSLGQNILPLLHQRYFEATRTLPTIINGNRFYRVLSQNPPTHQVNALSCAVAMAGAALSDDFPHLETLFYNSVRNHIEQAERQDDNSSFQNLEILQSLLLIARYEFTGTKSTARAWMTHGKGVRLAKLMCFDILDAEQPVQGPGSLRIPLSSSVSQEEIDERRRTFWVAFNMDFFISAMTNTQPILHTCEILTFLPALHPNEEKRPGRYLKDIISNPKDNSGSVFSPLMIATGIGNQVLQHLKLSADQIRGSSGGEYDFWTHHFNFDKLVSDFLSLSPFSQEDFPGSDDALLATTHLTLLGVSMSLHMRAYERALRTGCPESLANESRQRYEKVAMEISEALQQGGNFSKINLNVTHHLGMYLMWPISLAARVQVLRFKDLSTTLDDSRGAIYNSLRILDGALRALNFASAQFDDLFDDIRQVAESRSNTLLNRQEMGRNRPLSAGVVGSFFG